MTQKSIVFIDSRVANYQFIVASLDADTPWVLLDADHDGVLQMRDALVGYSGLDAIHIVSHGAVGSIALGSATLNLASLAGYNGALVQIGSADFSLASYCDLDSVQARFHQSMRMYDFSNNQPRTCRGGHPWRRGCE